MYEYDGYGNLVESIDYQWNHNDQYWDENKHCYTISGSSLSALYQDDEFDFKVFPNPTQGILNIHYSNISQDQVRILVINATGQVVGEVIPVDDELRLNMEKYTRGVYFIEFQVDGATSAVKKIIYK